MKADYFHSSNIPCDEETQLADANAGLRKQNYKEKYCHRVGNTKHSMIHRQVVEDVSSGASFLLGGNDEKNSVTLF